MTDRPIRRPRISTTLALPALACTLLLSTVAMCAEKKDTTLGYDDTPMLPDSKWRVHDVKRPRPRVVTPGATNLEALDPVDRDRFAWTRRRVQ